DSEFYDNENFKKTGNSLNEIELEFLTNLKGKKVLHLQCHFGQDSISISKQGAEVTGVDLSDLAIEKAQNLAKEMKVDTRFICSDVYDLPNVHNEKYDIVFSSYGTVGWLPDSNKWASVIS
ncbi:MAG: class I SAM-dependent methyltransferase, partial [Flavobacteriales bacterium]